jgi:hypothetical protein
LAAAVKEQLMGMQKLLPQRKCLILQRASIWKVRHCLAS